MTALVLLHVIAVWAGLTAMAELSAPQFAFVARSVASGCWHVRLVVASARATTRTHSGVMKEP